MRAAKYMKKPNSKAVVAYVNVYTTKIGKTAFASFMEAKRSRCPNSVFVGTAKIERCPVTGRVLMELLKSI